MATDGSLSAAAVPSSTAAGVRRSVGARIAALRRAAGLTQERLAERLAVSVRYLQSVEAGRENLTLDSLVRIAGTLRAEPAALLAAPPSVPTLRPRRARRSPASR